MRSVMLQINEYDDDDDDQEVCLAKAAAVLHEMLYHGSWHIRAAEWNTCDVGH